VLLLPQKRFNMLDRIEIGPIAREIVKHYPIRNEVGSGPAPWRYVNQHPHDYPILIVSAIIIYLIRYTISKFLLRVRFMQRVNFNN
jgi:hypothetical protein